VALARRSSEVALDRAGVALAGAVGAQPGVAPGPALAQQVPEAVELDAHLLEALVLGA